MAGSARAKAAPGGLTLRTGEKAGNRQRWYLGTREVKENAELLVQLKRRGQSEYVTGPGWGRVLCIEVDWLPVRATFRDVHQAPVLADGAARIAGQVLCLRLPFRVNGQVLIPATRDMQFAWPGPTTARAA